VEVAEFGAFVCLGPLDGLLHVSQITDEYISYDEKNARLVGKESGRSLAVGDSVRARIVAVSLNEHEPRESKIGLTMRQTALGKLEWLEEKRKKEGSNTLTTDWMGYVIIIDPEKSEIAKKMNITKEGKYALRVR